MPFKAFIFNQNNEKQQLPLLKFSKDNDYNLLDLS
jgi:hypothetical protein